MPTFDTETLKVTPHLSIVLPSRPTFIKTTDNGPVMAINTLHEQDLRRIGRAWTEQLVKEAEEARKARKR